MKCTEPGTDWGGVWEHSEHRGSMLHETMHLNTNLHGIISQNTVVIIYTVAITSKLKRVPCITIWSTSYSDFPIIVQITIAKAPRWNFCWQLPRDTRNSAFPTKSNYSVHRIPPLVLIVSPIAPVHAPPIKFLQYSFFVLSSHLHLRLPSGLLPSGLPTKTTYALLPHTPRLTHLSSWITRIVLGEEYRSWSSSLSE